MRVALCACTLLACSAATVRAQVIWAGGTGNWNDPINNLLNWGLLGLLPGISHTVTINSGVVSLNVSSDIAGLTIGSGGGLTILSGQSLTLQSPIGGGTLSNSASIQLASTGSDTKLIVKGGPLMLSGGGTLTLGNNTHNIVTGHLGTEQFINESTIQGAGQIGAGMLAITNNGTITANQSAGLVLQPNAGGLTNTGIIRATSGGTLTFSGGDISNFGGNVTAETGSTVNFSTIAGLAGGNVTTSGTGTINLSNSFLNSVTVTNNAGGTITINGPENGIAGSYAGAAGSTLLIADASTLFLGSATPVTLNGSLILASDGNDTVLWLGSGATSITGRLPHGKTDAFRPRAAYSHSASVQRRLPSYRHTETARSQSSQRTGLPRGCSAMAVVDSSGRAAHAQPILSSSSRHLRQPRSVTSASSIAKELSCTRWAGALSPEQKPVTHPIMKAPPGTKRMSGGTQRPLEHCHFAPFGPSQPCSSACGTSTQARASSLHLTDLAHGLVDGGQVTATGIEQSPSKHEAVPSQ